MAERTRATGSPQPPGSSRTSQAAPPSGNSAQSGAGQPTSSSASSPTEGESSASENSAETPDASAKPPTGRANGSPGQSSTSDAASTSDSTSAELHSGDKVTKRYRLEECLTRQDGFSSWRAVDEKLLRAVGVHVLAADHARAAEVLAAARSTALLEDPRFVQILDANEHRGLLYVIHEWLPDATPLSTLLQADALPPHDAAILVTQLAESMATAHRAGLAHLHLTPSAVLRSGTGPFRIRGLAVDAALRGTRHDQPAREDTKAIGTLLYAAQTQRWPYAEGAHGLRGMAGLERGPRETLASPEQLRADVHPDLSDLTMRALVNDGATATSEEAPCVTPGELSEAAARLPRIPPPDPESDPMSGYLLTSTRQATRQHGHGPTRTQPRGPGTVPPALPGRAGAALKWTVSALLIAALGLGSWQIADVLMGGGDGSSPEPPPSAPPAAEEDDDSPSAGPLTVEEVIDFDPFGPTGEQNPDATPHVLDGQPDTFWHTKNYYSADLGNLKPGVGLVLDLGEVQEVSTVSVDLLGETNVELLAAPSSISDQPPESYGGFNMLDEAIGEALTLTAADSMETRYLLVWLTELPMGDDGNYRGRVSSIEVSG